jgi:dynein assembly factor with WDR repeat domains 1
MENQE